MVRRQLARFRGREIDTAGDGFFASFDGPARAIRCAMAIADDVRALGLELRAGLHTGECELLDGKVTGIAVHVGARVAAEAAPGEVLVSSTVKDLVAGSGLRFEDRGERGLKGVLLAALLCPAVSGGCRHQRLAFVHVARRADGAEERKGELELLVGCAAPAAFEGGGSGGEPRMRFVRLRPDRGVDLRGSRELSS
jgi:hypothetical protein